MRTIDDGAKRNAGPMHAGTSRTLLGRLERWAPVDHHPLRPLRPLRPLGQAGMAKVDRAARVAKGQRGAAIDVPRANGSPFHPPPASSAAATPTTDLSSEDE